MGKTQAAVVELRPCPFCGSRNLQFSYRGQPATAGFIVCIDCMASGPEAASMSSTGGAISFELVRELWETRHSTANEGKATS